jgi:hypothetical protein
MHDQLRSHLDIYFVCHGICFLLLDSADLGFEFGPRREPVRVGLIDLRCELQHRFVLAAQLVNDLL